MDGKLLILCSERRTINEYGDYIDENGQIIEKQGDKYRNALGEEVVVDEHKRIINAMDLTLPMMPESIYNTDMLFVDWENVVPSDIAPLQEMIAYSKSRDTIPPDLILGSGHDSSLMRKAHAQTLQFVERPSIDYPFMAMERFMQLLTDSIEKNGVVAVLPAFLNNDSPEIVSARRKVLESWKYNEEIKAKLDRRQPITVLPSMTYNEFGEVYVKAQDEMMKIISKPFFFEVPGALGAPGDGER